MNVLVYEKDLLVSAQTPAECSVVGFSIERYIANKPLFDRIRYRTAAASIQGVAIEGTTPDLDGVIPGVATFVGRDAFVVASAVKWLFDAGFNEIPEIAISYKLALPGMAAEILLAEAAMINVTDTKH